MDLDFTSSSNWKSLNYNLLYVLIENNHTDSRHKQLKMKDMIQYLKSEMVKVVKKNMKTLQVFGRARRNRLVFLGDFSAERVKKKFSRVINYDFALDQMNDILYLVEEEAGMAIEKVLFLTSRQMRSWFIIDLLVDLFYCFYENWF